MHAVWMCSGWARDEADLSVAAGDVRTAEHTPAHSLYRKQRHPLDKDCSGALGPTVMDSLDEHGHVDDD